MGRSFRKAIAVLIMAALAASAAVAWRPTKHISDEIGQPNLELAFPKTFGDWRVDDRMPVVLPAPDVQAKLDEIYNQVLTRSYVSSTGERIMLSVAYGGDQSDGTRAHRPEVCYPAQGFQILSSESANLAIEGHSLHVRRLFAKQGSRDEPITYWVVVGDKVATSSTEQKLAQLRFGIRGYIPDGMLVRVSSIDSDVPHGLRVQERFVADLMHVMPAALRPRIFGS